MEVLMLEAELEEDLAGRWSCQCIRNTCMGATRDRKHVILVGKMGARRSKVRVLLGAMGTHGRREGAMAKAMVEVLAGDMRALQETAKSQ